MDTVEARSLAATSYLKATCYYIQMCGCVYRLNLATEFGSDLLPLNYAYNIYNRHEQLFPLLLSVIT